MGEEIQVGLIGVSDDARPLWDALANEPRIRLAAVADLDGEAAARCAASVGAEAYTDFRSLIVEQRLEALFIACPHHAAQEYMKLAAKKRLPVFKKPPLARRFNEALRLTQDFERARGGAVPLVVARPWPAEPAMEEAGRRLGRLGRPFLVEARIHSRQPADLGWRGDRERAGGGVLLHEAYPLMDTVIHWLGPPSEVFTAAGRASRPLTRYPYDTEDTAVVVLKYANGAIASFSCCWTSGPAWRELTIRASEGTIRIDPARVAVLDLDGKPLCTPLDRAPNVYSHPIRAFLDGLTGPAVRMKSLARDHLWTMAALEAAYLSARTGEAESPSKWFDILSAHEGAVIPGLSAAPEEPPAESPPAEANPDM